MILHVFYFIGGKKTGGKFKWQQLSPSRQVNPCMIAVFRDMSFRVSAFRVIVCKQKVCGDGSAREKDKQAGSEKALITC